MGSIRACLARTDFVVLLVCGSMVLLSSGFVVSSAWAGYEEVGKFPRVPEEESLGALPLFEAAGVATDDATGEVYVADGAHARVERLSSEGRFLGAWGWNTIKTGPGKAGKSFKEKITIERTSGGEDVIYRSEGIKTKALSYEAPAREVEEAIDELPIGTETEGPIKPEAGDIKVEKEGAGVYEFTYEDAGTLGDEESGSIGVEKAPGFEGTIKPLEVKQGEPAFEDCVVGKNGDVCRRPSQHGTQGGKPGEFQLPGSVAVDQATGDVYVLDPSQHEKNAVQVFTADGERTGVEFGESTAEALGKVGESEKNPEKLRGSSSIAVDSSGDVYIVNGSGKLESRVSVFDSTTGKYLGSVGRTCGATFPKGCELNSIGVDSAGNVYTIGEEQQVFEFQHGGEPTAAPVCELPVTDKISNLETLAVDGSGEVVVYDSVSHKFYWFTGCVDGKFKEESTRDFNGRGISASPSNLIVTSSKLASEQELRRMLLEHAKARGYDYGIVVRHAGLPEPKGSVMMGFAAPENSVLEVYRAYADGHDDLMHGEQMPSMTVASFKNILAVGDKPVVYNSSFLPGFASLMNLEINDIGDITNLPIASYVVPSLLFDEVTLKKRSRSIPKEPVSSPPL